MLYLPHLFNVIKIDTSILWSMYLNCCVDLMNEYCYRVLVHMQFRKYVFYNAFFLFMGTLQFACNIFEADTFFVRYLYMNG